MALLQERRLFYPLVIHHKVHTDYRCSTAVRRPSQLLIAVMRVETRQKVRYGVVRVYAIESQ